MPSAKVVCPKCGQPKCRAAVVCYGCHLQVKGRHPRPPLADRFWAKVKKSDSCWEWSGARDVQGYGLITIVKPRMNKAHRVAWELAFGPIPVGLDVCHHCDNPPCCNPAHLFLGTQGDNNRDRHAKGRSAVGERNSGAKLTASQVREIRKAWRAGGVTQTALATPYEINPATVSMIVNHKLWRHVQ